MGNTDGRVLKSSTEARLAFLERLFRLLLFRYVVEQDDKLAARQLVHVNVAPALETVIAVVARREVHWTAGCPDVFQIVEQTKFGCAREDLRHASAESLMAVDAADLLAPPIEV